MRRCIVFGILAAALFACAAIRAEENGFTEERSLGRVVTERVGVAPLKTLKMLVIPWHVNYQGYLTDDLGNPMTDTMAMVFGIWDAAALGTELWSEPQSVAVENGLFNVVLGSVLPIPSYVFQPGQARWLELTVESQTLSPRTEITSVGYSYRAVNADSSDFSSLTDMVDNFHASASPGPGDLFPLSFGDAQYVNENQPDAVTSPMIVNGEVAAVDLSDGSVTSAKILDSTMVRADVSRTFKAPYSDTADYARAAPATPDNDWTITGRVLHPSAMYGLSMRSQNRLYGLYDSTHVNLGVSCTTGTSGLDWPYCTVSGGWRNAATGQTSTVGGGRENKATEDGATVAGGITNRASYILATVGGGQNNIADNSRSTVCGGGDNRAGGLYSVVSGGLQNRAIGSASSVAGGWMNSAAGQYSAVAAGQSDTAAGDYSVAMGYRVRLDTLADYTLAFGNDFTTQAPRAVVFYSSGIPIHVGIQNTAPTHLLDVGTGGAYCDGGVWTDGSSRAYKENVSELELDEAIDAVKRLSPVKYNYRSDKSEGFVGFIAEDVPDLVATRDRKGLSPMDIVAVLTKVVQSQQKELESQREKIESLTREVESLRKDSQ